MKPFEGLPESRKTRARGTEFLETRVDVFFQFSVSAVLYTFKSA